MSRFIKGLKEGFSIFLILGFCIAVVFPTTGFSQWSGQTTQTVVASAIPSNTNPNPGEQITVAINFDMTGMLAPNDHLGSFSGKLNWDPAILSFVSHGGMLQGFVNMINTQHTDSGMITFAAANPSGVTGVFDVLVITCDAVGPLGSSTALDLEITAMAAAYTFQDLMPFLFVNDGFVTIGPSTVNMPPVLTPIPNQTMDENTLLDVPVAATDPDVGDIITLGGNNLPAFASFADNGDGTGTISFAPTNGDSGTYPNIEVIAVDNGTPSLSDTVSFELAVNPAPIYQVVSSAIPSNPTPNSGGQIAVAINFDMTGMPNIDSLLGSFTGIISWDPTVLSLVSHSGIIGFTGFVNANQADSGMITFNGANPFGVSGIFDVLVITFDVTGSPGNSTVLDLEYSAIAAAFTFHDIFPFLTVNDGMVTAISSTPNTPPQLTPIADQTMAEGETLHVPLSASDPDMNSITLSVNNLPTFSSFTDNGDGTGAINFMPGFNAAGQYPNIMVIATDAGYPPAADTVYFNLTVNDANGPPAIMAISDKTMIVNTTLNVPVSASDPDMDNIILSVHNLPAFGIFIDNGDGTGTISFSPAAGDTGIYSNIEAIAVDDGTPSLSDTVSFKLTVFLVPPNQIIYSAIPSNNSPNVGDQIAVAINFDMTGMSPPNNYLGSFTGTLNWTPTVLSFVSHSGIIGFTGVVDTSYADTGMVRFNGANPLGVSGIFDVLVLTFDVISAGGTVLDLQFSALAAAFTFSDLLPYTTNNGGIITVGNPGSPQITLIADQTMVEGEILNVPVFATDPDTNNITLSTNNLPTFGSLTDNGDGTGTISFMPGFSDAGTYPNIMVIATDDGNPPMADTVSFMLTVLDSGVADLDAPFCALTNIIPGPPKAIEVTVQDTGGGLGQVNILSATNANVSIPPFTPGIISPVVIVATKIVQNQSSTVTLEVFDVAGNSTVCDPVYNTISANAPESFEMVQNYPNPFNPTTTIRFAIPAELEGAANVTLKIYDLSGREVKTLINEAMAPGEYSVYWDATNNHGDKVAGGIYLYRLVAGDFSATKKMTLIK